MKMHPTKQLVSQIAYLFKIMRFVFYETNMF